MWVVAKHTILFLMSLLYSAILGMVRWSEFAAERHHDLLDVARWEQSCSSSLLCR